MTEISSTVSNGKRTSIAVNPAYQAGDTATIKFQGLEQEAAITDGPHVRGVSRHDRGYITWTVTLDRLDTEIEAAEQELF